MKELTFLRVIVFGIILFGLFAFFGGTLRDAGRPSPTDYVARAGDCFVPPQGDPLYDAWYAEHVNDPNCGAFVEQAQAHKIETETGIMKQGMYGTYGIFAVVAVILGLLVFRSK